MIAWLVTLPAFITLAALFFWTATSNIFGADEEDQNGENNGEGGRPWWDMDMRGEEQDCFKLVLNLLFLVIACATLCVPINKSGQGMYDRFNEGVLAASLFMFGNMLFVSFWLTVNFGRQEGEEDMNNYGNGYDYNTYYMDERQLLAYHQKVISYISLTLGLAFFAVAACIHSGGQVMPEHASDISYGNPFPLRNIQDHAVVAMRYDAVRGMWNFLSICSIVVFISLFIASCIVSSGEKAQRMVEEGNLINLIIVNLWMVIVTVVLMAWGQDVFQWKSSGSLSMGMLYGGTKYFAGLLLMICILCANPIADEHDREEGMWAATATSAACIVLSVFHFIFSMRAREYQVSLIDANTEDNSSYRNNGMIHQSGTEFVRVHESGVQMT